MRKYLFISLLFVSFYLPSFSQSDDILRREVDSLKKVLSISKGNSKVDCMNLLAKKLISLFDDNTLYLLDSACYYSTQAYNESKRTGYKIGLGYAFMRMYECEIENRDTNTKASHIVKAESYAMLALKIWEELNDNIMIGVVYRHLSGIERGKGDIEKGEKYLQKAFSYTEKPVKKQPKGSYTELLFTDCTNCEGNEFALAELYLSKVAFIKFAFDDTRVELMEKATFYFLKAGAKSEAARIFLDIATSAAYFKNIETSIYYIKKAISLFHEDGNEEGEFRAFISLCSSYFNLGDFENGLAYSKKSVLLAEELARVNGYSTGENLELYQAYYWVGKFYSIANDFETAFAFMRKARKYRSDDELAEWAIAMVDFHRISGNYDSAMYYMTKAGNRAHVTLSSLYVSMQQYDKALDTINSIIKIVIERNNLVNMGRLYTLTAKAYYGKNDYASALTNARIAFALTKKTSRNLELIDNYKLLSEIFNKQGKNDSAYFYLKQYTVLKDSLLNKQLYIRLNDYKKEAEEERKTSQINLLNKNIQLQEQTLKQEATIKMSLIAGLILLSLLAVFVFRTLTLKRKSELQKQKLENEKKQAELQQRATELEMQALRAQMNPHFIFNCLSSINKFILKNDTYAASDYLTSFSRLIRMSLTNSQLSLIPLSDEIEMLRLYLDMERLRFSETFDYNIIYENTIEPETIYIPPMLLQPFCENAIWHGLMHKNDQGKLEVIMSLKDIQLQCVITDNGIGREKAAELKTKSGAKQKSFGLKITTERLALFNNEKTINTFYNTEDVLDDEGKVAGTKVVLKIRHKNSVEETSLRSLR
jgi:hypothetical protein